MLVTLNYDPVSGNINDATGFYLGCTTPNLKPASFEAEPTNGQVNQVNVIKELVAAGLSVDDVLKLKREGAI